MSTFQVESRGFESHISLTKPIIMNVANTDYTTAVASTSISTGFPFYSSTCACKQQLSIETLLSVLDTLSNMPFEHLSEATRKQLESTICLINLKITSYM